MPYDGGYNTVQPRGQGRVPAITAPGQYSPGVGDHAMSRR